MYNINVQFLSQASDFPQIGVERVCPVADSSRIVLGTEHQSNPFIPHKVYDLSHPMTEPIVISAIQAPAPTIIRFRPSTTDRSQEVSVHRASIGVSQLRGALRLTVALPPASPVDGSQTCQGRCGRMYTVQVKQYIPAMLYVFLHTLPPRSSHFDWTYHPPISYRSGWHLLETTHHLSTDGNSSTTPQVVQLHFEKPYLTSEEHAPDAMRGIDIPPAEVLISESHSDKDSHRKTWLSPLLVDLAITDASMPYNVIILTCVRIAPMAE